MRRWAKERPFLFLTAAILAILLLMPLVSSRILKLILVEINFVVVLGVAISAAGYRKLFLRLIICFWVITSALDAAAYLWGEGRAQGLLAFINDTSSVLFILGCTIILLRHIFQTKEVSINSVFAATSSYLLLALIWSYIYSLIYTLDPQSFSMAHQAGPATRIDMIYFSMVTISTLGYGDMTPVAPFARMAASVEAVGGQLYLAVLMAWLVGLSLARRLERQRKKAARILASGRCRERQ
ncbi:hypothetical protein AAU61_18045 [Desulfocarbo indianensis]|nr:hypothetical protein AAU61_18045 [Desulfocarbo indianensis]